MKVIQLHQSEKKIIQKACAKDRNAQRKLYEKHAPKMNSVCRYYVKDIHEAEDVMMMAFFKAFKNLKTYTNDGNFEGWLRKIMVNECISFHRKKKTIDIVDTFDSAVEVSDNTIHVDYNVAALQKIINQLPEGYKMVFVLFAVEGYSHKEIALQLNISVNTSKSQLHKARKMLQQKVNELNSSNYGTQ